MSHEALEEHARRVCKFTFHNIDSPIDSGWRVRWGKLDPLLLTAAGAAEICAAGRYGGLFGTVLGLTVMSARLILLDEEAQRSRTPREFATTLIHELIHSQQRSAGHGPEFQEALRSATNYFFGAADAPAPPSGVASVLARPESAQPKPLTGMRFRPGGLDPFLEYRG